jgi:hypothetical protein
LTCRKALFSIISSQLRHLQVLQRASRGISAHSHDAKRVPLSGAVAGFEGDIAAIIRRESLTLECKSRSVRMVVRTWWACAEARPRRAVAGDATAALLPTDALTSAY